MSPALDEGDKTCQRPSRIAILIGRATELFGIGRSILQSKCATIEGHQQHILEVAARQGFFRHRQSHFLMELLHGQCSQALPSIAQRFLAGDPE